MSGTEKMGISSGACAGYVIAGIVITAAIAAVMWCCMRSSSRSSSRSHHHRGPKKTSLMAAEKNSASEAVRRAKGLGPNASDATYNSGVDQKTQSEASGLMRTTTKYGQSTDGLRRLHKSFGSTLVRTDYTADKDSIAAKKCHQNPVLDRARGVNLKKDFQNAVQKLKTAYPLFEKMPGVGVPELAYV